MAKARLFEGEELVLATHNKGKVAEFSDMLKPLNISVIDAAEARLVEPDETGKTFTQNAVLKAKLAAEATGKVCLADDSGLAVDALDGAPGIYSARWAENEFGERDFVYAMTKLLNEMQDEDNREAAFVAVLAIAWPDGHVETFEGRVDGLITRQITGDGGFGYDPVFIPEGETRTFGQMSSDEKKSMSHRGRAVEALFNACFLK